MRLNTLRKSDGARRRIESLSVKKIILGATSIMALALLAFAARPPAPPAPSAPIPATPAPVVDAQLEVERITLTRFGFEPDHITRPPGEFMLAVSNRSETGDVDLVLSNVAGLLVQRQQVSIEKLDWSEFFNLPPGDYVLTEARHPEWQCKITVTPN